MNILLFEGRGLNWILGTRPFCFVLFCFLFFQNSHFFSHILFVVDLFVMLGWTASCCTRPKCSR